MSEGGGDKKSGVENFPPPIPGQGKSRDLAAGKLGVNGEKKG
jgi:hypothetical protein